MIKKVYGRANNLEIMFTFNEHKGLYETAVPRSMDGAYYLDLYAEDVAGNVTFMATALFEFDPSSFKCSLKIVNYAENEMLKEFNTILERQCLVLEKRKSVYTEKMSFRNNYVIEVVNICCL